MGRRAALVLAALLAVGGSSTRDARAEESVYLRARVEPERPYVGQQIRLVVEVVRTAGIFRARFEAPDLDGLVQPGPWVESDYDSFENGRSVAIREYATSLFATRAGRVRIGAARFECEVKIGSPPITQSIFDDFYTGRHVPAEASMRAQELEVRPVPSPPPGIVATPLVGRTELKVGLVPESVPAGQAATLSMEVRSEGRVSELSRPRVAGVPRSVRVVEDTPSLEWIPGESGILGRKQFTQALIPEIGGRFEIEPVRVAYFDPARGAWAEAEAPVPALEVRRVVRDERASTPVVDADAIRTVWIDPPERPRQDPTALPGWPAGAAAGAGLLVVAVLVPLSAHRRRLREDPAYARARRAEARARAGLGEAERALASGRRVEGHEGVSRALAGFVGDRLGLGAGVRTPEEIERHLSAAGVDGELRARVKSLLERCERARLLVGSTAAGSADGVAGEGREVLEALDRALDGSGGREARA